MTGSQNNGSPLLTANSRRLIMNNPQPSQQAKALFASRISSQKITGKNLADY